MEIALIVPMKKTTCCMIILACFCLFPARAIPSYSYQDIHPAGWLESHGVRVNSQGDVAGYGTAGSGERGFLWRSGVFTEILPPGASSARVSCINDRGDVAGTAVFGGQPRAFFYSGGAYFDPAPGWAYSEASDVSEEGIVTGKGEFGAFISRNGVPEVIAGFSAVIGINASGEILGTSGGEAILFIPGTGSVILSPPGSSSVVPRGLNESGVVAFSSFQAGTEKGYVYSGGFYIFMTPQGWTSSNAMAINNGSQVVGYGISPAGRRSFVRSGSAYEELAVPGWISTDAASINDSGHVAGSGESATGETHAFLASPAGTSPQSAGASSGGPGAGGGGCTMAPGTVRSSLTYSSVANLLLLLFPVLPPALSRARARVRRMLE